LELYELTIHEAHDLLEKGEISSVELTQAVIDRIVAVDNEIKAYITLTPGLALEQAKKADRRRAAGEDSPLLGIPLAIKDVICTEGVPTTCGSKILEDFVPPYDATVMAHLGAQGAVLLGKTNMDEFAMGSSTENSAYFVTHNPWDLSRVPGGSSGGSAAAIAADECLGALGSDTGGSVRQPAAFCGVAGLKPTYGRVSRYGLVAFASSLDQIGPFGKDVADCAILMNAIVRHDPRDSTSVDAPVPDYTEALVDDIEGMRVGVPKEYFVEGMQPEVEQRVREAVDKLAELGAEVAEVSLPHTEYSLPTYYLIAPAEARQSGFGAEVKRRIMLGTYALSAGYYDAYYLKAQKVRTLIKGDFDRAFEDVDVIAAPTSPTVAFKIGEKVDDPLQMYLSDIFTLSVNLAGICGISIPCGFADGLPVGLQIIGKPFAEKIILRVAYAYEQAMEWHRRRPAL
jgi:aspartyl-tRNA(Asn)/glutamyl-tRNA(Gln) amidotransferase subunit A